jgi:hypothetical protein
MASLHLIFFLLLFFFAFRTYNKYHILRATKSIRLISLSLARLFLSSIFSFSNSNCNKMCHTISYYWHCNCWWMQPENVLSDLVYGGSFIKQLFLSSVSFSTKSIGTRLYIKSFLPDFVACNINGYFFFLLYNEIQE